MMIARVIVMRRGEVLTPAYRTRGRVKILRHLTVSPSW